MPISTEESRTGPYWICLSYLLQVSELNSQYPFAVLHPPSPSPLPSLSSPNRQHTPSSTLRLIISFSPGGRYSLPYDGMAAALAFLGIDDGKPSPTGGPHELPRLQSQTNTNTLKLSNLPPELIILIASMLSTRSAACLSLCNRAMSQILGPNIWRCLNLQNPGMRASFLSDLSKDLPQYFVCYRCVQLHASSAVQWPRTTPKTLTRCLEEEPAFEHCSQSGLLLRFPHIQLAMNGHYLGPSHGFPLEAFQSTEVIESDLYGNIVLLSVDAQIVSNELLMRSQQWVLLPHSRRDELITERLFHHLCHHIWALGKAGDNLPTLMKSRLDLLEEQGRCCTSTAQCLKCPMDFVMDAVDLGERGIAGCLTRWVNLGAGLHPADPKWRSHLGKSLPQEVTYEPHPLGSIRSSFENQTSIPFKDLTTRNIYNLLSRRERKLITRRADGFIWKLVCNDPHRWCLEHAEQSLGWGLARISQFLSSTFASKTMP